MTESEKTPLITVQPVEEFRLSDALVRFEGQQQVPLSVFITEFERGDGPPLHFHPYPEIFLVERGVVQFTAEAETREVAAGNFVVVAAETKHRFEGASDETSRVVSVHPAGEVIQTNLP